MFGLLKSPDFTTLPAGLQGAALVSAEQNTALITQGSELESTNSRLENLVKKLNQLVYAKRSEKLTFDEQQLAFEDLEVAVAEAQAPSGTVEMTKPHKKRKLPQRNLGNRPKYLSA